MDGILGRKPRAFGVGLSWMFSDSAHFTVLLIFTKHVKMIDANAAIGDRP